MNYETKRDVFEDALRALEEFGEQGSSWEMACDDLSARYSAASDDALPDDLPVIPNYVAEYIDAEKNNNDVVQAGIDAIEYSKGSIELTTWIEKNGDTFARAWLDGYEIDNKS